MFFVTSKERIISVFIAFSTVFLLLLFASIIKKDYGATKETSSHIKKKQKIVDIEELWENNILDKKINK